MLFQTSLTEPISVDNFAGGGGASTGIELATGRPVTIAINHDPDAILMHQTNHPYTEHYQASVWDVDPVKVCRGRPVGLAWFSPDCKHFSKAKGAALVDRKIRGLAWIVLRWAAKVRPAIIILENVEEFQTWGPVRKGKPVKKKAGQTFFKWKRQLKDLGYHIEHRELVAADYGAPTIRKRFYLIARCDGKPIVWPKPTHSKTGANGLPKWRSAAEIIDWSLPMYSVFSSKKEIKEKYGVNAVRPLAENTLRRVIRGVDKFTIQSGRPFLVQGKFHNGPQDVSKPLTTVTAVGAHELVDPLLTPVTFSNTANSVGAPVSEPVYTVRSAGGQILSAAQLIQYHTEQNETARDQGLWDPLSTVDGSNRYGLAAAQLAEYYGNGAPLDPREPMHTVTGHDREALTVPVLQPVHAGGYHGKGNSPEAPLNTVTGAGGIRMAAAHVVEFKGQDIGQQADRPLRTVTASAGEFALCHTTIAKYRSGEDLGQWPKVRALLNRHCGYHLAEDEVLLLLIGGEAYYIRDILLRMLSPRELYAAMGFPPDYIIDRDYLGNKYGKTKQVARCGNAVCPPMAEAIVRANVPEEWRGDKITTMAQLMSRVAV